MPGKPNGESFRGSAPYYVTTHPSGSEHMLKVANRRGQ